MCFRSPSPISLEDGLISLSDCYLNGVHLLVPRGLSKSLSIIVSTGVFFAYPLNFL